MDGPTVDAFAPVGEAADKGRGVECWLMLTGRVSVIDLSHDAETVEALRALLTSQGAVKVTDQEESPAVVEHDEGENTTTTIEGAEMSTSSMTDVQGKYNADDVAAAFDQIDQSDHGLIYFEPHDALFQDVPAVKIRLASELLDPEFDLDSAGLESFVHLVDASGQVILETPEGWWDDVTTDASYPTLHTWRNGPNHALRLGNVLAISHGMYLAVAEQSIDGERAFEFISWDERTRREQEKREAYLDAHPEILAAQPEWADTTGIDYVDEDGADVGYERQFGPVSLNRTARFEDGRVRYDDDTSAPSVYLAEREGLALEDMRELASALMAAIPVVEEARAH